MTVSLDRPTQNRLLSSALFGFHEKQNDPATDERNGFEELRNKVMMEVLKNAQAEEILCLSRGREGDARVTKCHDAENDQNECNH